MIKMVLKYIIEINYTEQGKLMKKNRTHTNLSTKEKAVAIILWRKHGNSRLTGIAQILQAQSVVK